MSKDTVIEAREKCPVKHIAFIMDGNGRWAKKRGLPREFGHKKGAEVFEEILSHCGHLGIEAVTFYVFSTENWKRPEREVNALMKLLYEYLDKCEGKVLRKESDCRFILLGDRSPFTEKLQRKITRVEEISKNNRIRVNLAINYGGRDELVHAFNKLYSEGKTMVTEQDIANAIYTAGSPELDMIVRTGGDLRISNFLLWQTAYAELYFTDTLWPDFTAEDVDKAVEEFKKRQRRFGGV